MGSYIAIFSAVGGVACIAQHAWARKGLTPLAGTQFGPTSNVDTQDRKCLNRHKEMKCQAGMIWISQKDGESHRQN